ncbi:MAG TPA: hypothetical protein VMN78_03175 [Longimicrobiales bacterium]|nr:hypothetical protein [Longimicrobiales bacterium]
MSPLRIESLLAVAGGLFSFLVLAQPVAAQNLSVVQGRVADGADNPIGDVVVVLHQVTGATGVELDRDSTDAAGAFELRYAHEDGPLYFVATRIDGDIFMGEPFRAPPAGQVVLRAGAGVEPLRLEGMQAATSRAAAPPADDAAHRGWWVAAIGAIILGFVAWLGHRGRHRAPRARELMLEIARLDENRADAAHAGSEESYRARRAELRDRLVEALELDHDADRH